MKRLAKWAGAALGAAVVFGLGTFAGMESVTNESSPYSDAVSFTTDAAGAGPEQIFWLADWTGGPLGTSTSAVRENGIWTTEIGNGPELEVVDVAAEANGLAAVWPNNRALKITCAGCPGSDPWREPGVDTLQSVSTHFAAATGNIVAFRILTNMWLLEGTETGFITTHSLEDNSTGARGNFWVLQEYSNRTNSYESQVSQGWELRFAQNVSGATQHSYRPDTPLVRRTTYVVEIAFENAGSGTVRLHGRIHSYTDAGGYLLVAEDAQICDGDHGNLGDGGPCLNSTAFSYGSANDLDNFQVGISGFDNRGSEYTWIYRGMTAWCGGTTLATAWCGVPGVAEGRGVGG